MGYGMFEGRKWVSFSSLKDTICSASEAKSGLQIRLGKPGILIAHHGRQSCSCLYYM